MMWYVGGADHFCISASVQGSLPADDSALEEEEHKEREGNTTSPAFLFRPRLPLRSTTGRSDSSDKVVQQIINCKLVGESRPSVVSIRRSVGLFLGTGRCRLRGLPKKVDKDGPDPPPRISTLP